MRIPLNLESEIPLYRQIETHLRQQILSGSLEPGTRLPATRQLAQQLGVSRITVKNAYAELESDGLIQAVEGSGTYVLPPPLTLLNKTAGIAWPLWQQALQTAGYSYSEPSPALPAIVPKRPLIAFTGVGDPHQYPSKHFLKAMQTVLQRDGLTALEYGDFHGGYPPLRQTITHILGSQGIQAHPDHILITSGSQQGLALVCQLLLKTGDAVLVEEPTYNFALELFRTLGLKIIGIPLDGEGMQVGRLETLLQQHHPQLIYTIPNFQNPSGACLSGPRRRQLVTLAGRYNIPILEDDFVGELRYDGRSQPAIKALDPGGQVIYTGTFSKILMPGLRVGFLVAEGPVLPRLASQKRVNDLTTSPLTQRTLDEYISVGRYQAHLRRSCRVYRRRRDVMLAAIRDHLPLATQVQPPQGGLFIWLRLPEGLLASQLHPIALEEGIEFAPGPRFFPDPGEGESYLRLNFATQTADNIIEGIRRLGLALQRCPVK